MVEELADSKDFPTTKWLAEKGIECDVLFKGEVYDVTFGGVLVFDNNKGEWDIKGTEELLYDESMLSNMYILYRTAFEEFKRNLPALKDEYINQKKIESDREIQKLESQLAA